MCQDLNRVELSSPTSGPSFQPAAKGLGVSISGGQTAVVPAGETFSYTINVTNDSNETATGVMLVAKLDDSSTFVFASSSRGQCSQSGVEVACPLGSLAGGASASVSITLIAATSGLVAADSITLSAASGELSADQSSVHRTTIVYGSTTPASGGLSVSLSDEVDPVVPGETLTYIVTVSNDGSQAVGGVSIVDSLPLEVELVSVSSSQGSCIVAGGVVVCSLGILEAGASAIVSFGATVSSASSTVTNDVTVSGSTDGGDEWITTDSESTTVAAVGTDRSITGSVRDSAGNPIPGVPIVFFTSTGGLQLVGQVSSDSSGSYIIEELIPGTYFAFASPQQSPNPANFVDSWYDQKQNMQQANLVDVTIGSATEVDFQLRSRLPHRAYFGKVIEVNPNNFSTETKFGIVRAGTGPGTSVAAPGIGLADGGTLAPGQRVAVLTDLPSLVGADVADSELVTAIHVTIIPNKPRRDHLRGVVAEKAPDGKATVVLEAGNTLRVSEAQAKTMTGGAHVVMVVHSVGADKKVEVLGSVHSDAIQDRLDNFLGAVVAAGITGAALSLESLRGAHLAQVDFSTEQSQDNADEDIKDSLDAAISQHAEDERQKDDGKGDHAGEGTKGDRAGEGTKDGQGGKDGEGSKDGGGGHEGERVDQVKNWRRPLLVGR